MLSGRGGPCQICSGDFPAPSSTAKADDWIIVQGPWTQDHTTSLDNLSDEALLRGVCSLQSQMFWHLGECIRVIDNKAPRAGDDAEQMNAAQATISKYSMLWDEYLRLTSCSSHVENAGQPGIAHDAALREARSTIYEMMWMFHRYAAVLRTYPRANHTVPLDEAVWVISEIFGPLQRGNTHGPARKWQ